MTALRDIEAVRIGGREVVAVMAGDELVWPAAHPYERAVLRDNPVAFWPLTDTVGTVAEDLTGRHPGIYTQNAANGFQLAARAGPLGVPVVRFQQASIGRIEVPHSPALALSPNEGSLEVWFRLENKSQYYWLFSKTNPGARPSPFEFFLYQNSAQQIFRAAFSTAQNGSEVAVPGTPGTNLPPIEVWCHAVATYEGSGGSRTVRMYLNGEQKVLASVNADMNDWNSRPLCIGSRSTEYAFQGSLAYGALYDYPLSAQQVKAHYDARAS